MRSFVASILAVAAAAMAGAQTLPPAPQAGPVRRMRMAAPPPAFQGDSASAPLTLSRSAPVVEATIGGKGPYRFLIDTGTGGHGRISPAIAQQLGLAVAGEVRAGDGSGRVQTRRSYRLESVELGGVTFKNVQMAELPVLPGREREIDGILGVDLFANHLLTLDYGNQRLTLSRDALPESAISYPAGPGPITLPLVIGNETLPTHLDTGNSVAALIIPQALTERLPLTGPPRSRGEARTAVSTVKMWEADIAAPVALGGVTLPIRTIGYPSLGANGNLGSKALAGTILRLDQRNRRVAIEWPQ
jgi:predicted aspartyl protease